MNVNWQLNFRLESRNIFSEGVFGAESTRGFSNELNDLSALVTRRIRLTNAVTTGFLLRWRENKAVYRTIQQYSIAKLASNYRMSHRFAMDQTFSSDDFEWRFRYRIAFELPLQGHSVDIGEWYLKLSNEYLNGFSRSEYDLEIRLVPILGYKLKDTSKLEFGLDYRLDRFFKNAPRHRLWQVLSWYIVI